MPRYALVSQGVMTTYSTIEKLQAAVKHLAGEKYAAYVKCWHHGWYECTPGFACQGCAKATQVHIEEEMQWIAAG